MSIQAFSPDLPHPLVSPPTTSLYERTCKFVTQCGLQRWMILVGRVCDKACFACLTSHEKLTRKRRQLKLWNCLVTIFFMLCSAIAIPFNPAQQGEPRCRSGSGRWRSRKRSLLCSVSSSVTEYFERYIFTSIYICVGLYTCLCMYAAHLIHPPHCTNLCAWSVSFSHLAPGAKANCHFFHLIGLSF